MTSKRLITGKNSYKKKELRRRREGVEEEYLELLTMNYH